MTKNARYSLLAASIVAGIFACIGGWMRRWMSDDGLIVLRTVRNLLAGNGPVFNAGERVEANTSTLWQYLITVVAWLTDARLEDIATWLALASTVLAAVVATYASGKFWGALPVLPFGAVIYFALPPARDFATSGLEWGLSLAWLAVWWALLVHWSGGAKRLQPSVGYWLAFWCGLSWLVRPELALYGGLTGIVLLVYSPRRWWGILLAALPVPAAYQVFRMGYYGLLTPHTAVAKSAAGSQWAQGVAYVWDFVGPYALYVPLVAAVALGVWAARAVGLAGRRAAVALLVLGCALLHVLYVVRVGGDFMHGRMLLLPLFALLLPVMAVPLTKVSLACGLALAVWASVVIVRAHPLPASTYETSAGELGVVDEREFWTMALHREPGDAPMYAEDFLDSKLMTNYREAVAQGVERDFGQLSLAITSVEPEHYEWFGRTRVENTRTDLQRLDMTVYLINLGMTSMNASLNVRVLDTVGLATPLAARMPRDPEGRVGHDKNLGLEWQVADTAVDVEPLPDWLDKEKARQARAALRSPEIAELLATSREPMSWERFKKNVAYALGKGRTLEIDDDPSVYLNNEELRLIKEGKDVGLYGPPRIAW